MNQEKPISLDHKENSEIHQVKQWLQKFSQALNSRKIEELQNCFSDDAHWRDLLSFTWSISPFEGGLAISEGLLAFQVDINADNFLLAHGRTEPRTITRLGVDVIEGIFTFETRFGKCEGVVRLLAEQPSKAWIFLTTLFELKGYEEKKWCKTSVGGSLFKKFWWF